MTVMGFATPVEVGESKIESSKVEQIIETVEVVESEPTENIETDIVTEEVESITFKVTAYCPCKKCSDDWGKMTSTGVIAEPGRTIAVDPRYIPYGTEVTINGNTYVAEDSGGAIKGNRIDIYFDSHQEALEFGVQYLEGVVYW